MEHLLDVIAVPAQDLIKKDSHWSSTKTTANGNHSAGATCAATNAIDLMQIVDFTGLMQVCHQPSSSYIKSVTAISSDSRPPKFEVDSY